VIPVEIRFFAFLAISSLAMTSAQCMLIRAPQGGSAY
jgi:hypothetical protein